MQNRGRRVTLRVGLIVLLGLLIGGPLTAPEGSGSFGRAQAAKAKKKVGAKGDKKGGHGDTPAASGAAPEAAGAGKPEAAAPPGGKDPDATAAKDGKEPAAPDAPPKDAVPARDGAPAAATASAPSPPVKKVRKLRVTVLPVLEKNFPEQAAVALQRDLSEGLRRNSRLDHKDLDVRLAEFAQEVPFDQVELARTTFQNGREALFKFELDKAVAQLSDAVDQLVQVLPYIKKQELADAMMALAAAQQQKGATKAMQGTLRRLLTWRTGYQLDTDQFPASLSEPLEDARVFVGKQPQGELKVLSEPLGAQVFVDGEFAGVAPTTIGNLAAGEHYITFRKLGYKRGLRVAQVQPPRTGQVLGRLDRADKYLLVDQALERTGAKVGESPIDPVVDNLRETLFLDHAVFLKLGRAGSLSSALEEVNVSAFLYDLRSRRLLEKRTERVRLQGGVPTEGVLQKIADELYAKVDYDADEKAPEDPKIPKAEPQKPLYKRWWLWTAIGGAVAVGAAALGVGLALRQPSCPDGHVCTGEIIYSLTFRY